MAQLPLSQAVDRFKGNEDRIDTFVNDPDAIGYYVASDGSHVKTLPQLQQDVLDVAPAGRLLAVQVLTSTGTYSKPAGTTTSGFVIIDGQGGGGGGAGAVGASSQMSVGGGGGGGGYFRAKVLIANISDGATVTVGAAGTAGANTGGNGGAGGSTSVAINGGAGSINALGGNAGQAMTAGTTSMTTASGGSGGQVTATGTTTGLTFLESMNGGPGDYGVRFSGTQGIAGRGGSSKGSPATRSLPVGSSHSNGFDGIDYGGGGSAAASGDTTGGTGGAGQPGYVVIYTFA